MKVEGRARLVAAGVANVKRRTSLWTLGPAMASVSLARRRRLVWRNSGDSSPSALRLRRSPGGELSL